MSGWDSDHISKTRSLFSGPYSLYTIFAALMISFSTIWFMRPVDFYIFGQDSYSFIHPLYYSVNPFYSYNNGIENIFYSSLVSVLSHLMQSPQILERSLAVMGVFVSLLGLIDLINLFKKISGSINRSTLFMIIPMIFYVYNPYTLTVTWPHFSFMSVSMIVAPFVISFLTYSIFYGFNIRRFTVTALILMILAGSISGSMLPFFLIITFLSMVLSGIYVFIRKISLIELLKREISIVTLTLIATMFAFVPLYFSALQSMGRRGNLGQLDYSRAW